MKTPTPSKSANGRSDGANPAQLATPELPIPILLAQLSLANGLSCVLLEGARHLRQVQLKAAGEAQSRHELAQQALHDGGDPNVMTHALKAAATDLQEAWRYWMDLAQVCNETQMAWIRKLAGNGCWSETMTATLPRWTPMGGWHVEAAQPGA